MQEWHAAATAARAHSPDTAMLTSIVDSTDPRSIAARLRRRRFQLFERLLGQIPKPVRILDIGGTEAFWRTVGFVSVSDVHITLLNVSPQPVSLANFTSIVGDARDLGGFADGSVDVVYSNSVIEHVGGHGDQRRMADEVRRVGVRYFIQTPNRCFPLEPHFVFPFFQFLPIGLRVWLLRHADLGWHKQTSDPEAARRIVEGVRLLNRRELLALFPGGNVFRERLLGFTKSFVVYGGWGRGS